MSETPQETLEKWLGAMREAWQPLTPPHICEAIRAVLAEKHIGTGQRSPHVLAAERALRQAEAERDALRAEVEAVLALHVEWWGFDTSEGEQSKCHECERPWPCPTRRALEGEK